MNKSNNFTINELLRLTRFYKLDGERIVKTSGRYPDPILNSRLNCDLFRTIIATQKTGGSRYVMSSDTMKEFNEKIPDRILSDEYIVGHCEFGSKHQVGDRYFDEMLFRRVNDNIEIFYVNSDIVIKQSLPVNSFPNQHFRLISNMLAYVCLKVADPEIFKEADVVIREGTTGVFATRIVPGVLNSRKYWKMQHYGKKNCMRRKRLIDPDKNGKITARMLRSLR